MQETRVWSPGQEYLREKGMATHSSILNWRIPWTEEMGGLWSMGLQRVRHGWTTEKEKKGKEKIFRLDIFSNWFLEAQRPECQSDRPGAEEPEWVG